MRLHTSDIDLLATLVSMPFLDRLELAGISGRSPAACYQRIERFEDAGLVESLGHSSELITPTRRYCLTAQGVYRLSHELGASATELMRSAPVSEQWRRLILERLDGASAIYRLADSISGFSYPTAFQWRRASPMDATLDLPDRRRVAIVRQGMSSDRTAFAKRIHRLRQTPGFGLALVLCPDETRLRHARRLVSGSPAITLLAIERDVVMRDGEALSWRGPSGSARLTLREALSFALPASGCPAEPPLARCSMPGPLGADPVVQSWLLPSALTTAEKRAYDILADWTWIRPVHLAGLLGVGRRRLSQLLGRLDELGLLARVVQAGQPRLALSDRGLAFTARRDRASVGNARKRWSVSTRDQARPLDWESISGIRARQLLRNLDHTESVHWFNSLLAGQAREQSIRIVQLDPPHRASRYFRHADRLRSIHPDGYSLLCGCQHERAFFLEWERRAVRPATMLDRLAPYLRYYSTTRPIEDHGLVPSVLVVFEDGLTADHFLSVAERAMAHSEVRLPLLVSDRESIKDQGPLGPAWRAVEQRGSVSAF